MREKRRRVEQEAASVTAEPSVTEPETVREGVRKTVRVRSVRSEREGDGEELIRLQRRLKSLKRAENKRWEEERRARVQKERRKKEKRAARQEQERKEKMDQELKERIRLEEKECENLRPKPKDLSYPYALH